MKNKLNEIVFVIWGILFSSQCFAGQSNDLDEKLLSAMNAYRVPVVGYAIIQNYKIVSAETLSVDPVLDVSKNSIFQAASISKSLSAYGILKLVSNNKLSLDESVNSKLITWKIPVNEYNRDAPIKVRQLLDMTSGLSISGFPGHEQGVTLPTLKEVLNGELPSNTGTINVFYKPGSQYFYSGGAFQVLEQLLEDITKKPFPLWMNGEILKPLKMENSVFQYPLTEKWSSIAIPGFLSDGTKVKGGWNNYAIAGAGGAWSTPIDLAKFAIDVSKSFLGKDNNIITRENATQMLSRQKNTDYGLGFVVNGDGENLNFRKSGHNLGYHNQLIMFPNQGDGAVIMTNSENGYHIINYIIPIIAQKYDWPCYFPYFDELVVIPEKACV